MSVLSVKMLGGLKVQFDGAIIERFPTRKVSLLVAVLALEHPRSVSRERLISVLWPEASEDQGRQNLRQALALLRKTFERYGFPSGLLRAEREHVSLQELESDVATFGGATAGRTGDLVEALASYDRLLPGFYEDYIVEKREELERAFVAAVVDATCLLLSNGRSHEAVSLAKRAIEVDNLCESAHVALVRALVADRRFAEAEAHVAHVERLLEAELGCAPSDEVRDAFAVCLSLESNNRIRVDQLIGLLQDSSFQIRAEAAAELADRAFAAWYGPDETEWTGIIATSERELISTIEWASSNDALMAIRIAGPLGRYWLGSREFSKGKLILERVLDVGPAEPSVYAGRAMVALFVLMLMTGGSDLGQMQQLLDRAEDIYRRTQNRWGIAHVTRNRGLLLNHLRQLDRAREAYQEAIAQFQAFGDEPGIALSLLCIGMMRAEGEYARGFEPTLRAYDAFAQIGNLWGRQTALQNLSGLIGHVEPDDARQCLNRLELELSRHTDPRDRAKRTWLHAQMALVELRLEEHARLLLSLIGLATHATDEQRGEILAAARTLRGSISQSRIRGDDELLGLETLHRSWYLDFHGTDEPETAFDMANLEPMLKAKSVRF